jgi:N-acetylmuramoyl-L-alanine amidase
MTSTLSTYAFVLVLAMTPTAGVLRAQTPAAPVPPVERLYADAAAEEKAVKTALAAPDAAATVLKAVRTVVADFENVARRYPSSGYSDDALWRAARMSISAFDKFGDVLDRKAAIRLLQDLAVRYPTGKLARQVPQQLAALEGRAAGPSPVSDALDGPRREQAPASQVAAAAPAAAKLATIKGIRRIPLPDAVRVIIELDAEVTFHDERIGDPPRVFVDLPSTRTDATLLDKTIHFDGSDNDIVRQIRIGRHPGKITRVVLDAGGVSSYSVYPLYSPYRLVIDCLRDLTARRNLQPSREGPPVSARGAPATSSPSLAAVSVTPLAPPNLRARDIAAGWTPLLPAVAPAGAALLAEALAAPPEALPAADAPAIPPAPSAPASLDAASRNLAGGLSLARQLGLGVSRIVIDPGHGGHDPGAKSSGVTEADLVLEVALRLETLLSQVPGTEVVLTRRSDEYVALQERTAIANRETADLFLSIHANANSNVHVNGIETYFLNFATNLSAAAVAARENAASGQAMGALPDVVKAIALHNKLDESRDFATFVQRAMMNRLRGANKTVKDLGVKQAPFVVLIGAAMPSVLTEISFVTNPQEARLLKRTAYRQRIAEALFDAIRKYQTSLKHGATAAQ